MILKTLILKNYRKFKDEIIEFPDGITGVVGLNGVGKSTIFEALAWVLYGSVAARTGADQIKRDTAKKSDSCQVILEFQFEGDGYRISREMSGKNLAINASLMKNSNLIATGAGIVNKYIQNKLGMDFKSFYTSIFAKQKELNALSTMNASERRPLILRMLGINSMDDIIKEINTDKKMKQSIVNKLSSDLIDENGNNKIEILKKELLVLKKDKKNFSILLDKKKEEINLFKKNIQYITREVNEYKKKYEQLNSKNEKLNEKKLIFERKLKLKEDLVSIKNKINDRYKIIEVNKNKLKEFNGLQNDIDIVNKKIKKIEFSKIQLLKLIEEKKTIKIKINDDIQNIILKKEEINKIGNKAKCPTCERVLGKQYNILKNKYINEISNKKKEISIILENLKKEKKNFEKITRENSALDKKREYLFKQLRLFDNIKNNIKIYQEEIERDKLEIEKIINEINRVKDIKFDYKLYNNIKKSVKKYYSIYQTTVNTLEEKKDNLSEMKLNLQRKKGEFNLILNNIHNTIEKINDLKKIKKSIENEFLKIRNLKILYELMISFRSHLILRIRPILSSYAADFFSKLTDGKYQDIELDELYNIIIFDNGIPYNIKRFSGGEEDLANLCLRLSISEVISEKSGGLFNFIVLDEIFGSQDIIHQQNIMKALNVLSSKFKQIILITHIDDIKNHVENIISVNESEGGISTIKIE
jgi:exonuclease SbcC